jgi:hypothetical protein
LAGAFDRVDNSEAIRRAVRDAAREGERRVIVGRKSMTACTRDALARHGFRLRRVRWWSMFAAMFAGDRELFDADIGSWLVTW